MSIVKNLQKYVKTHHLIALLGLIVLAVALGQFSDRKASSSEGAVGGAGFQQAAAIKEAADAGVAQPAAPAGQNEVYASATGLASSTQGLPPSCLKGASAQPGDLLPRDNNNEFSSMNPGGAGDLQNVNLLKAGYHAGIDTVAGTLRNANLQVRSEPPNPTTKVSPWMNSTIEPDLMRVPLEIGCGPQ